MIQQGIDTPWRVWSDFRRRLAYPYIRLIFWIHGVGWGRRWRIFGTPMIQRHRGSRIELGDGLSLRSWRSSNPLAPNHPVVLATRTRKAIIQIGDDCGFTGGSIVAAERVQIGNRVLVGANCTITDTDFHPLEPAERRRSIQAGQHRPVVIEDDVFIGMNCLILKGVTVGRGSAVGAGSVVTKDVPAGVVAAGNPARVIRAMP